MGPALIAALLVASLDTPAGAQDRLVRTFGPEQGLTTPVWGLAQDSTGFLWIGTDGGLFRFDGTEFRKWASDSIRDAVQSVTVGPDGRVAALDRTGTVFEVTSAGARSISSPVRPSQGVHTLAYDSRGVLWVVDALGIHYRSHGGDWQTIIGSDFNDEPIRHIKPNRAGAIDVLTDGGLWRIGNDVVPRKLVGSGLTVDAVSLEDGRTFVLQPSVVLEVSENGHLLRSIPLAPRTREIAITERHGTVWVARDQYLVAIRPGESFDAREFGGRISFGGPLLVDREGSL